MAAAERRPVEVQIEASPETVAGWLDDAKRLRDAMEGIDEIDGLLTAAFGPLTETEGAARRLRAGFTRDP